MKKVKGIKLSLQDTRLISELNEIFLARQIKKGFKQPRLILFKILNISI